MFSKGLRLKMLWHIFNANCNHDPVNKRVKVSRTEGETYQLSHVYTTICYIPTIAEDSKQQFEEDSSCWRNVLKILMRRLQFSGGERLQGPPGQMTWLKGFRPGCWPGFRPGLQRSPDPLAGFKGPTSKGRKGKGEGGEGRKGKGWSALQPWWSGNDLAALKG